VQLPRAVATTLQVADRHALGSTSRRGTRKQPIMAARRMMATDPMPGQQLGYELTS
jgi:hypothetical protein